MGGGEASYGQRKEDKYDIRFLMGKKIQAIKWMNILKAQGKKKSQPIVLYPDKIFSKMKVKCRLFQTYVS